MGQRNLTRKRKEGEAFVFPRFCRDNKHEKISSHSQISQNGHVTGMVMKLGRTNQSMEQGEGWNMAGKQHRDVFFEGEHHHVASLKRGGFP